MAKSQTLMSWLPLLLLSSIAIVRSRPTTLSRRGVSENCDPLFGGCDDNQWPFSPISSSNTFISRSLLRSQTPPLLLPSLPRVVVPPPPTVSDPTFSPLVASPPPPGNTIPPPDDDTDAAPPLVDDSHPPEITLPPVVHRSDHPHLFLSPPLPPDFLDAPAPPLVPIVSQQQESTMPPPPTC